MTRSRPSEGARIAGFTIVAVLALTIAAAVVRDGLARALFADARLSAAYALQPDDGLRAGYFAWTLQHAGLNDVAARVAREAIHDTPIAAPAVGALAAASATRDPALAAGLLRRALAMSRRDAVVQIWGARVALGTGRVADAALHADAAARVGDMPPPTRALIDTLLLDPAGRDAIARRLARDPPWRRVYLTDPRVPPGRLEARVVALAALTATPVPPTARERAAVVNLVVDRDGLPAGLAVWRRHAPDAADARFAHIVTDPALSTPFDWSALPVPGGGVDQEREDARGLHVRSDGSAAGPMVARVVAMPPGARMLTMTVRQLPAGADPMFRWQVRCVGPAADRRGARLPTRERRAGDRLSIAVDVPAADCPAQLLTLEAEPADMPGVAEAWFDRWEVR